MNVVAVAEEDADPDLVALLHVKQQAVAAWAARVEPSGEDPAHLVAVEDDHGFDGGVESWEDGGLQVVQAWDRARELACMQDQNIEEEEECTFIVPSSTPCALTWYILT